MKGRVLRSERVHERAYDGTTRTLRAARCDMADWLADNEVDDELIARAALVVSELASNAVQASSGVPYDLRVGLVADGSLVISLASLTNAAGPPPRGQWGPPTVLAATGRGLMIVDELSDSVTIDRPEAGRLVVTATLH